MARCFIFLLLACVVWAPLSGSAQTDTPGLIEGTVVNGTPGGAAVGMIPLHLRKFRGQAELESRDLMTSATGAFRIEGLEVAADLRYFVEAGYRNIAYRSEEIDLTVTNRQPVQVIVYETTDSDLAIGIDTALLEFGTPDQVSGTIDVTERVTYSNAAPATFIGNTQSGSESAHTVVIPLPEGAFNVAIGHGFAPNSAIPFDGGMATTMPIPPGQTTLIYAYKFPYLGTSLAMRRHHPYAVAQLFVLLRNGPVNLGSPTLQDNGTVTFDGNEFKVLSGADLAPNAPFNVALSALPRFSVAGGAGSSVDTVARGLGIGLMALAVAALFVYTVRRRSTAALLTSAAAEELVSERNQLLASIAGLDLARENGTLGTDEHARLRDMQKQRLVDVTLLLREQQAKDHSLG